MASVGRRPKGPGVSQYTVYVTPRAWQEIQRLPGNVRQRVRRAVDALAGDPRPPHSARLDASETDNEIWRLRMDRWRIVYGIDEQARTLDVLSVRRRPPYDYGDLTKLIEQVR